MSALSDNPLKTIIKAAILLVFIVGASVCCEIADNRRTRQGWVTWYGHRYRDRVMANGQNFDPGALTCATWDYPLGTRLLVSYKGKEVRVTVTDRGPDRIDGKRIVLDLSLRAFLALADPAIGLIRARVSVITAP